MQLIFTQHIRTLASGAGATDEELDATWDKLQSALKHEMVRRGLWNAPPSFLGVFGRTHWSQPEAFDELLSDCYVFNFIQRLKPLSALLDTQENIEGVVFRNIQNFLFDQQKRHDPVGFRLFRVVRQAVRRSVDAEGWTVVHGNPRIDNSTILAAAFDFESEPITRNALAMSIGPWPLELLPELLVAKGQKLEETIAVLCRYFADLVSRGIECFRFKDLIDAFKNTVRPAWTARWPDSADQWGFEDDGDAAARLVPTVPPDSSFEVRQRFQQLLDCMPRSIAGLDVRSATRSYLERLWMFLQNYAAEEDSPSGTAALDASSSSSRPPAGRQLAHLLDIPRYRLPELRKVLGQLVNRCRGMETTGCRRNPDENAGSCPTNRSSREASP